MVLPSNRIDYLDSVRGILSLIVVIYHYIGWRHPDSTAFHVASFIFNGSDAVSFFFVLSGFVLSYKYFNLSQELNMREYIIKRVFRIFPGYIVMVLLHQFYLHRKDFGLGSIYEIVFKNQLPLWNEMYLVKAQHSLYIPGWTLGVEMVGSLLLPFFIIVAQRNIRYIYYLIPILLYIGSPSFTLFGVHFCLGMLLAYYYPVILNYTFSKSKLYAYRWILALATFFLFSIRHQVRIFPLPPFIQRVMEYFQLDLFHLTGLASFVIMLWIINSPKVQSFLRSEALLFLGKISFGLYLVHFLILCVIMDNWEQWQAYFSSEISMFVVFLVITIFVSIVGATVMYYLIEFPFIKYGSKLGKHKQQRSQATNSN